jgi:hypothetical protein
MDKKIVQIPVPLPNGTTKNIDCEKIQVDESNERWSEIKLTDGSVIRIKQLVADIFRAVDDYDPDGNPLYIVKSTPIISIASVPDSLKKKK